MRLTYEYPTSVTFRPGIGRHTILLRCLPDKHPFQQIRHEEVLLDEGFCFVNMGPEPRMSQLYPQGKSDTTQAGSIDPVIPAAIASLMVKLAVRALIAPEKLSDSLYHLDLSAMELERFSL